MKYALVVAVLAAPLSSVSAHAQGCNADAWRAIVSVHIREHPSSAVEDVYKLLHQGVFGSEHAVPSRDAAAAWLADEIATLDVGAAWPEHMVEPIAPDSAHVRVHLRPFLRAGGAATALLDAFVATANEGALAREPTESHAGAESHAGNDFACAAAAVTGLVREAWPDAAWESFVAARTAEGLPAGHHSADYTAAYRPAYRVVARRHLSDLFPPGLENVAPRPPTRHAFRPSLPAVSRATGVAPRP